MAKKPETFLTITEAAKRKGVSRAAIYNAIRQKRLIAEKGVFTTTKVIKITRKGWRIPESELDKYQPSDLHVYIGKKKD
jgi:hypothetical protein